MAGKCNFSHVHSLMIATIHQLKVFQAIILSVAILVMNNFVKRKALPDSLLHYDAMQITAPTIQGYLQIWLSLWSGFTERFSMIIITVSRTISLVEAASFLEEMFSAVSAYYRDLLRLAIRFSLDCHVVASVTAKFRILAIFKYFEGNAALKAVDIHRPRITRHFAFSNIKGA